MQLLPRERAALEYNDALKQRYKNLPEIKRIARCAFAPSSGRIQCACAANNEARPCGCGLSLLRHRHVPKAIYSATKIKRTMLDAIGRREANEREHSREGEVPFKSERKKHIVTTEQ